jgi:hypothetical protein
MIFPAQPLNERVKLLRNEDLIDEQYKKQFNKDKRRHEMLYVSRHSSKAVLDHHKKNFRCNSIEQWR